MPPPALDHEDQDHVIEATVEERVVGIEADVAEALVEPGAAMGVARLLNLVDGRQRFQRRRRHAGRRAVLLGVVADPRVVGLN